MAVPSLTLNVNHYMGLVFAVVGWIIGWYSLVLITADNNDPQQKIFPKKPTNSQWYGIIFAVAIAVMGWFQRILSIQGEEQEDP
jgi:hypothetical protein|tara:strand:+ start:5320 stop:5571 length:252 start_codon:yes stop_codon:yes gene_type:complete